MTGLERKIGSGERSIWRRSSRDLQRSSATSSTRFTTASTWRPVTELLAGIEARVAGLERTLENRSSETGRTVSFIGERLRGFEEAIGGQTHTDDRTARPDRAFAHGACGKHGLDRQWSRARAGRGARGAAQAQCQPADAGRLARPVASRQHRRPQRHLQSPEDDRRVGQGPGSAGSTIWRRRWPPSTRRSPSARCARARFRHWLFGTDEWYSASYDTNNWRKRHGDVRPPVETRPTVVRTASVTPSATPPAPPPSIMRR